MEQETYQPKVEKPSPKSQRRDVLQRPVRYLAAAALALELVACAPADQRAQPERTPTVQTSDQLLDQVQGDLATMRAENTAAVTDARATVEAENQRLENAQKHAIDTLATIDAITPESSPVATELAEYRETLVPIINATPQPTP